MSLPPLPPRPLRGCPPPWVMLSLGRVVAEARRWELAILDGAGAVLHLALHRREVGEAIDFGGLLQGRATSSSLQDVFEAALRFFHPRFEETLARQRGARDDDEDLRWLARRGVCLQVRGVERGVARVAGRGPVQFLHPDIEHALNAFPRRVIITWHQTRWTRRITTVLYDPIPRELRAVLGAHRRAGRHAALVWKGAK